MRFTGSIGVTIAAFFAFAIHAADFRKIQTIKANGAKVTLNLYQSADNAIVEFRASNADAVAYNIQISTDLDNMQANTALPFKGLLPARTSAEVTLFSISRIDAAKGFYFRNLSWNLTAAAAGATQPNQPIVHNGTYAYPWAKKKKFRIDNAFNGYGAHQGDWAYAVDFKMPEGTDICAAREGTVIQTEVKFSQGGNDPSLGDKANFIYIQHSDGSIGRYLHIRQNGALVKVNAKVKAGQKIAKSGNVGWSTDPHLHFDIIVPKEGGGYKTVPFKFRSPQGKLIEPKLGLELKN